MGLQRRKQLSDRQKFLLNVHCKNRRVRLTQFGLPQLHQKVAFHHGTVVESL